MRRGLLSKYFDGVAVKRLSAVEADTKRSNQHEFNGVNQLKKILGADRQTFTTRFVWLGDEQEGVSATGFMTWYDAREHHVSRSEYRFYFSTTPVSELAKEGDALFIAKRTDGTVLVTVTPASSTIQNQLLWLFDLPDQPELKFTAQEIPADTSGQLDFAVRYILDELEIEYEEPQVAALDSFVEKLEKFPTTREFSLLARQSLPNVSAYDDPDATLLAWMEREEQLFRIVERKLIGDQVRTGFASGNDADVDGFLTFSKSVQNRRKSRAGAALEHHLEAIFETTKLKFERGVETENRNRPDFLFPGKAEYLDMNFPASLLTMLGAKSTLKDRWRQVLQEANRINEKHLLTLEPGISEKQTDQIRAAKLQLVVPTQLQDTFRDEQKKSLINVSDFIKLIRERQNTGR